VGWAVVARTSVSRTFEIDDVGPIDHVGTISRPAFPRVPTGGSHRVLHVPGAQHGCHRHREHAARVLSAASRTTLQLDFDDVLRRRHPQLPGPGGDHGCLRLEPLRGFALWLGTGSDTALFVDSDRESQRRLDARRRGAMDGWVHGDFVGWKQVRFPS
jgi:hypothetical protein